MIFVVISAFSFADILITELTDPQNSSDAGRYVELYNNGDADVDLSTGWALVRWTNGNTDPQSPKELTGTISAGGFYVICNDADKFSATFGSTCDQDVGTGGPADSNGDDNIALLDDTGAVHDMFGLPGEDGSGTGHEFEDGRAERNSGVCSGNATWDESEWTVDNDSGGGDGNQYAPEAYDPGSWVGSDFDCSGGAPICEDELACNTGATGDCEYVNVGWGNLQWPVSTSMQAGGTSENIYGQVWVDGVTGSGSADSGVIAQLGYGAEFSEPSDSWTWTDAVVNGNSGNNDEYAGQLSIEDAGVYSYSYRYQYGSSCWYYASEIGSVSVEALTTYPVTFNVDASHIDVDAENGIRIFGLISWSSGDAISMSDDDGDGVFSATVDLTAGDYQFKYRNGWDYENVEGQTCASESGGYWNRDLSVVDSGFELSASCFGACEACNSGCTDPAATNYDETANVDDGSCEYPQVDPDNIFFSEYGEGSGYNKYLEIYNASDAEVDLANYQRVNCSNGCDDWEYYTPFADGATVAAGDVYVVCDSGVGEDFPVAECDEQGALYFNGDDMQGIYHTASATTIDVIGEFGDDPGSGWEVAGVNNGTKDHSIVRDISVTTGNTDWASSSASEWLVFDQNTWTFIGSHPHDFASTCDDEEACNTGEEGDCVYADAGFDCDGNPIVSVTFNVDMSQQTVDTEGYGLDLFLDGWHDMVDEDGDGIHSVTLSLTGNSTYTYKFKNGDEWEVNFNDLGCGAGDDYGNRLLELGDADVDLPNVCFNSCSECVTPCSPGDVNDDGSVDVLDIVSIVNYILDPSDEFPADCGDYNGDGIVNVLDIVAIVDNIMNSRGEDATRAELIQDNGELINTTGFIGAVHLGLTHNDNFTLELTKTALVADYKTSGNSTTLIVVSPEDAQLFSTNEQFEIVDVIVANSQSEIDVSISTTFGLSAAYPNPFNPSTTIELNVSESGTAFVSVYDLAGRQLEMLSEGHLASGTHSFNWNAVQYPSGVYLIKAQMENQVSIQKVVLMK